MNNLFFFAQNKSKKEEYVMHTLYKVALVLATVGCINWGLVGLFNFNLVEFLFGDGTLLTRIVYVLVFIAGLLQLGILPKDLDD